MLIDKKFNFDDLAERLSCDLFKAKRCWEIWIDSAAFNYPTDKLSAIENRRKAFQRFSGLPDQDVVFLMTMLEQYDLDRKAAVK